MTMSGFQFLKTIARAADAKIRYAHAGTMNKGLQMNAFTIPKQSIMRGQRPPVRGDYNNKGYWRGIPVVGSEQGKKDNMERWKRAKAAI